MDASARTWKTIAKSYRWVLSRCDHNARLLSVWQREDRETIKGLRAEVARLKELQPCSHSVQAIRSTPYIGDQHSNYCGWCADVDRFDREHELCQTLTAELLEYRGQVARLRKALAAVEWVADGIGWEYCAWCHGYSQLHLLDCQRQAALSTPADDQAPTT